MNSGQLRVAFNRQNVACIRQIEQRPGIAGPCVDIATQLTAEMHVRLVDREYDSLDAVFAGGRQGDWDVAFVVLDERQAGIAFTPPYLLIEQTYLVAGNSQYRSVADLDVPGARIAVFSPSAIERYLRANLKNAMVVVAPSITDAIALIESRQAEAYAGSRSELESEGWRLAGGRVLSDSITKNEWAVAVASGRADLLTYVTRFLDGAKHSGAVQDAIDKYRLEGARTTQ